MKHLLLLAAIVAALALPAIATASDQPTATPSEEPSATPSESPSEEPSATPSEEPSASPSEEPSATPSESPSVTPSESPSETPTGSLVPPITSCTVANGCLPPTDTVAPSPASSSSQGILLAVGLLVGIVLVATVFGQVTKKRPTDG